MTPSSKILLGALLVVSGITLWATMVRADDAPSDSPVLQEQKITPPPTYTIPDTPVVKLKFGNQGSWCTGYYIGDGNFATAGHCEWDAGYASEFIIYTASGDAIPAKPAIVIDARQGSLPDQMIIHTTADLPKDFPVAPLYCSYTPKLGDEVSAYGFPGNVGIDHDTIGVFTKGYVAGLPRTIPEAEFDFPMALLDLPIVGGFSGAPAFHDGKVIGTVVVSDPEQPSWAGIMPVSWLCKIEEVFYGKTP